MKDHQGVFLFSVAAGLLLFVLAACSATPPPNVPTAAPPPVEATAVEPAPTEAAEPTTAPAPTNTPSPLPAIAPTVTETAPEPAPSPTPSLVAVLLAAFPGQPQAKGQVVLLFGRVLDVNGDPIPGAAVEIWQTDAQGVYDHPGDRSTANRDRSFQFYGTSVTGEDGVYVFRTIEPGYYEPRPKHIHVKVRIDGREALTTQFYFEEDRANLGGEGVFSQAGGKGDLLIPKTVADAAGEAAGVRLLSNDLVFATGSGPLTSTPAQTEGPYYPLTDVSSFDNDLTVVP